MENAPENCRSLSHDSPSPQISHSSISNDATEKEARGNVQSLSWDNFFLDQHTFLKTNGVINRKSSSSPKDLNSRLTFQVRPGKAVQTDFK